MALGHGANIVRDGLVFAYDMANTKKSWKGAPTTNVVTNTDLDTGWSKNYCTDILWNDYPPPNGVTSQVVSFVDADGNGSGYWYSYGNYAPQEPSTTYCISVYARTVGSDWTIRAYTANNSEVGRQFTNTLVCPGDGNWHRLEFNAITTPADTQSDSLSFIFPSIPAGQRCWLCAPQMTATEVHVPFVNGTRNSSEALIDWTKNTVLTVDSLLYQSDNTFKFDGTGTVDGVVPGSNILIDETLTNTNNYPNGCTYLFWLNVDIDSPDRMSLLWGRGTIEHIEVFTSSKYFRTEAATQNGYSFGSSTFPYDIRGVWAQFAIVFANAEENRPVRWYQNGEIFHTGSLDNGTNPGGEYFSFSRIGRSTGSTSYTYATSFKGQLPVFQVYNRALTESEVKQNFEALRGRYGI